MKNIVITGGSKGLGVEQVRRFLEEGCRVYVVANMRGEAKKRAEAEHPTPAKPKPIPTDIPCDECGSPMVIRNGRTGPFLGCSKYPKCKATKPMPAGETAETLAASKA